MTIEDILTWAVYIVFAWFALTMLVGLALGLVVMPSTAGPLAGQQR